MRLTTTLCFHKHECVGRKPDKFNIFGEHKHKAVLPLLTKCRMCRIICCLNTNTTIDKRDGERKHTEIPTQNEKAKSFVANVSVFKYTSWQSIGSLL